MWASNYLFVLLTVERVARTLVATDALKRAVDVEAVLVVSVIVQRVATVIVVASVTERVIVLVVLVTMAVEDGVRGLVLIVLVHAMVVLAIVMLMVVTVHVVSVVL